MSHVPTVLKSDRSVFDKMLHVDDMVILFPNAHVVHASQYATYVLNKYKMIEILKIVICNDHFILFSLKKSLWMK